MPARAFDDARANPHAALPVAVAAHALLVLFEIVDAFRRGLASFPMRCEFANDRGIASRLQPGYERIQSFLSLGLVWIKRLQGIAQVFGRMPEIENEGGVLADEELMAQVADLGCAVRNRHLLPGLAQPRSGGFAFKPRSEVRVAARAAASSGAVDETALGLAVDILFRLAGFEV